MRVSIGFENKALLFDDPQSVITCNDPSLLNGSFEEIERLLDKGFYAAGFLSYEAGYSFEEKLFEKKKYDFPLLMMGAYRCPRKTRLFSGGPESLEISNLALNITKERYSENIARIREHIARGDVYQITYCIKLKFDIKGDERSLFRSLFRAQPVPYPAIIEAGDLKILSLSPERFIKKNGTHILSEPMKGTWMRGKSFISDMIERYRFSKDEKNKAENIMIADLLRNDLGRIGADIGWPKIYTIAKYRTLFQMTSTVTGKVDKNIKLSKLMAAIFPSGSVTGAPRIRAMEIIRETEKEERKIYTGAIGYITPERDMYFNIPIRTLLIKNRAGEMGVGGGIVWDSTPQGEWDEGMLKAKFLTDIASKPFENR